MENVYQAHPRQYRVHKILAHSYTLYFFLFLVGVYLDFIFPFEIFTNSIWVSTGILLLIFSTILIIWAQKTSRNLDIQNIRKETFYQGPYRYARSPTHWGLFLLMFGFGIIRSDYMGAKNFPKFRYPKYTQRNFLPRTLPLCQEPNALGAISLNVRIWNYRQRSVCDFIHSYFLSDFSVHLFKETGKYFG